MLSLASTKGKRLVLTTIRKRAGAVKVAFNEERVAPAHLSSRAWFGLETMLSAS